MYHPGYTEESNRGGSVTDNKQPATVGPSSRESFNLTDDQSTPGGHKDNSHGESSRVLIQHQAPAMQARSNRYQDTEPGDYSAPT